MSHDFMALLAFLTVPFCLLLYVIYLSVSEYIRVTRHNETVYKTPVQHQKYLSMWYEYDPSKGLPEYPQNTYTTSTVTTTVRKRAKRKQRIPGYMGKNKRNFRNFNQSKLNPIGFLQ